MAQGTRLRHPAGAGRRTPVSEAQPSGTVLMRDDRLTVLVPRDLADSLADVLEREATADRAHPPTREPEA